MLVGELLRRVEQLDTLVCVHRAVVGGRSQAEHRPSDLVDVRGALSDRRVGAGNPSGPARTRLKALGETQLEVGKPSIWPGAIAESRVDLRVSLKPNGRPEQPPASFLQRQPRADNLRCLFARSCQHLGERQDPSLGGRDTGVNTHRRPHRDGSRTHAHANSFYRLVSAHARN